VTDLLTVASKEWKELFARDSGRKGGVIRLVIFAGILGVIMPLQAGPGWVDSPAVLLITAWVPLFLISAVVADAFAGERERHTLETLLASRLPDDAVLFGKLAAAVGYGWGATAFTVVLSLITTNVRSHSGGLLLFPPDLALAALVASLVASFLAGGAGVLVSLRAATVRQAQQTLSIASLLVIFLPMLGIPLLPDSSKLWLADHFIGVSLPHIVFTIGGALAALDVVLLVACRARFKRQLLILQ
jgi:ABC-2 type transport system permease protein